MATYTYKGYKIVKRYITPYHWDHRHVWDVMTEEQYCSHLPGEPIKWWHVTYTGKTLEECKRAIRGHFGRL